MWGIFPADNTSNRFVILRILINALAVGKEGLRLIYFYFFSLEIKALLVFRTLLMVFW
jgi:hypothetical protein